MQNQLDLASATTFKQKPSTCTEVGYDNNREQPVSAGLGDGVLSPKGIHKPHQTQQQQQIKRPNH